MKINQIKIPITLNKNYNWKLVREKDQLTKYSEDIKWIGWEDSRYKKDYDKPAIGLSLIMSPFINNLYTWLTTTITVILEETESSIKFKTQNSTYTLYKI